MPLTLKYLSKFAAKTLLLSLIALLVLVAIAAGIMRMVTPVLAHQRALIQQIAGWALEQPVQIGSIKASWDRLMPAIELQQVTVGTDTASQQALKIAECAFDVNVFNILLTGHVHVDRIKITGTHFFVHQLPDGSLLVNGLWNYQPSEHQDTWYLPKNLPFALADVTLTWYNQNNTAPLNAHVDFVGAVLHLTEPEQLDAEWQNLSVSRTGAIPGVTTLNGELEITADTGSADINTNNTVLDFGPLFRAPIPLAKLSGHVEWQHNNGDWTIKANNFVAQNNDGVMNAKLSLLLPKNGSSPTISLLGGLHVRNAQHIGNYLPLTTLRAGLIDWLTHAVLSFSDAQGTIVLRGKLADFPFDKNNGTFIIDNQLKNVELRFWSGWPVIHNINADLIFSGHRMDIRTYSARIINTPVQNITAYIPLLQKGVDSTLYVNGSMAGDIGDGLTFLHQSPVHGDFLDALKTFTGSGPMQLQLHLTVPLEDTDKTPPSVTGQVAFTNNILNMPQWHVTLNNLQGKVSFTRDSVTTLNNLTATLWEKPLKIVITPDAKIQLNYNNINAVVTAKTGHWQVQLQSPNLQGQMTIAKDKSLLQINFSHLYLSGDTLTDSKQHLAPQDLPALNFSCNDLRYGDKKFGQVQLQLRPVTNGTTIALLQASSPAFNIKASGNWLNINGRNQTQLRGTFTSSAISDALTSWDLPAGINAKQSTINFNLNWPDSFYNPAMATLNGQLSLDIKQGEFTDVGRGTAIKIGIGRLLNLLSINSLVNDLKLNFGDLKSSGFTFDKLNGDFTLQNGDAFTKNTAIKSTVADINMKGRIGLATKDSDLQMSITPHMTSSLPVIIGLAGGPIAGAVTWAADKLLTSAVKTITTSNYSVTGPWGNPTIVKAGTAKK